MDQTTYSSLYLTPDLHVRIAYYRLINAFWDPMLDLNVMFHVTHESAMLTHMKQRIKLHKRQGSIMSLQVCLVEEFQCAQKCLVSSIRLFLCD